MITKCKFCGGALKYDADIQRMVCEYCSSMFDVEDTEEEKEYEKKLNPWFWIPTLYFAEGIPYFLVNNISVMMFTKMGVPNGQMALFTSLLYLPWTIKPFWSPFVDIIKTKRWWFIAMQILMTAAFVLLTITIPHPSPELIASGPTSGP